MSSVFYNTEGRVIDNNPLLQEHIGVVIDVNDPLNLCRIRVYIPDLLSHDNISWITRMTPNFPGVMYATPKLGDRVRVWFRNNNIMDGVYGLDYTHMDNRLYNFKAGDYGFVDNVGNTVKISDKSLSCSFDNIKIAANSIKLDADNVSVRGNLSVGNGYTGSFTTKDGFTVNVLNGIITDIV